MEAKRVKVVHDKQGNIICIGPTDDANDLPEGFSHVLFSSDSDRIVNEFELPADLEDLVSLAELRVDVSGKVPQLISKR
jgi:hypothetical protein